MFLFQGALLLDVRTSELAVVFPEADFDVVEADIEIFVALFELPASDGEVSFEGVHDELAFFEVDSGVSGVDETTAVQGFDDFIAVFFPAGGSVEVPGQI